MTEMIGVGEHNRERKKYIGNKLLDNQEREKGNLYNEVSKSIKLEKSTSLVGQNEIKTFCNFFGLRNDLSASNFERKVKEIQEELKFSKKEQDGVLGPKTLEQIYLKYYIGNEDNLPLETRQRIKIYKDMKGYKKPGKLNVFKNMTFMGVGENIEGTFINKELNGVFPKKINNNKNIIKFENIKGKTALTFYINGNLELATYASPGKMGHHTPGLKTTGNRAPSLLHVSSDFPIIKNKLGEVTSKGGAVMPYAVNVNGPVWIHGSDGIIDGRPRSHGCIRTGLYYVEHLHKKVKELGVKNVIIDTSNIYA